MPTPTSIRLTEDELALIQAHAARLQDRTGRTHTTSDVVRYLLRAAKPNGPKDDGTPLAAAYTTVFGKDTP